MLGDDKSEVEALVTAWSKLSPSAIGGPSELKNIEIKEIKIGEITDSKWNNLGCKDCKETEATLVGLTTDGLTENIVYQLRKFDGKWVMTAWEVVGKNKGACYPPIDLDVINARKSLQP
jgi:hypothetical protein